MERIDRLIANSGHWSRKEAHVIIKSGRVRVDTRVVRDPAEKISPEAQLFVNGERIGSERLIYLMLHKPQGVVSSTEDPREDTVLSLLPLAEQRQGLFPVGRLDKDATGLLLLTNDGALAHRLLSPRNHVDKVYEAQVDGSLGEEDVRAFEAGITLRDGTQCLSAGLRVLAPDLCRVRICEGKYHQVKRMLASRGATVRSLKRLSMGELHLDENLPEGAFRHLHPEELETLGL